MNNRIRNLSLPKLPQQPDEIVADFRQRHWIGRPSRKNTSQSDSGSAMEFSKFRATDSKNLSRREAITFESYDAKFCSLKDISARVSESLPDNLTDIIQSDLILPDVGSRKERLRLELQTGRRAITDAFQRPRPIRLKKLASDSNLDTSDDSGTDSSTSDLRSKLPPLKR